ncbi:hypothetical protein SAMN05443544_0564 [Agromyces cerinus subsp. cerinus]|uniref:DUF7455 domain-containing protein n=1 Tax=Agromyces cerinus subsp. cerinus TaxID=232089 RepID=A0A1N6DPY2_9MICO|nr:hypothetical protein SAMN05443544_0564 [Agromyces cerinus subsp. cerinus]
MFGVVVVTGEPSSRILTHADRCDVRGCGARAFARGLFSELREEQKTAAVDMCGHHFLTAPASFREQAYHVIDETDRILED